MNFFKEKLKDPWWRTLMTGIIVVIILMVFLKEPAVVIVSTIALGLFYWVLAYIMRNNP